jgi:hypothetical protein
MAKKQDGEAKQQRRVGDSGVCAKSPQDSLEPILTCSSGGGDASKSAQQLGELAETHNVIRPLGRCKAAAGGVCRMSRMCRMGVHDARAGRRRESSLPAAAAATAAAAALPGSSAALFFTPGDGTSFASLGLAGPGLLSRSHGGWLKDPTATRPDR